MNTVTGGRFVYAGIHTDESFGSFPIFQM